MRDAQKKNILSKKNNLSILPNFVVNILNFTLKKKVERDYKKKHTIKKKHFRYFAKFLSSVLVNFWEKKNIFENVKIIVAFCRIFVFSY